MLHLDILNYILYSAGNLLNRNIQIDPVLIEQIDGIDPQSLERSLCDLFDVFWSTIESASLPSIIGVGLPSELRRDYNFPVKRSKRFAYQFFVEERTVYLGGIEERDTSLHGGVQQRNHLLLVFRRPVGPTHSHATESDGGNLKIAFSKFAFSHCFSLYTSYAMICRGGLVVFPSDFPVFLRLGRLHDELLAREFE